jgi:hypothetical protein
LVIVVDGALEADLLELGLAGTEPEAQVRYRAAAACREVLAVLRLVAGGGLRCSEKTRRPSAATVVAVSGVLEEGDFYPGEPVAAFAWPLLLQAGGLAEVAGGRLQLTTKGRAALLAPPERTIRQLWSRWVSSAVIDEMSRVEEIKGQRVAGALSAAGPRRKAVAAGLGACEPGAWILIEDLFAGLCRRGPRFAVARNLWKLYLVDREYGSLGYDGFGEWPVVEGRYVLAVLFEYAGALGLFDLAYQEPDGARDDFHGNWGSDDLPYLSRYDGLLAVRMNELGAYVFGHTQAFEPPVLELSASTADRPVKVLPNHDVVVTGTLPPSGRLVLDAFARQTSERVWTITLESVLAALGAGRQVRELAGFLSGESATEVPPTLTRLLGDAEVRARVVRDEGVVRLISCADVATATLVARDRRAGRYCRLVGDRYLAVPVDQEAKFRAALAAVGYPLAPDA